MSVSAIAAPRSYMLPEFVRVIDGDTIKVILTPLKNYPPLDKVNIRIFGIDTPESNYRAKCDEEKQLGLEAKSYLKDLIGNRKRVKITGYKYGKYGGRILAILWIDGKPVSERLIEKGYAKPYFGSGPRPNWCEETL